ncbi:MAG: anthranilate phosphoribosyltransferase [Acidobacteria bacterium]|nr:anthranilate phosphoribosyltransferase [Acidobacteriota bacterium]
MEARAALKRVTSGLALTRSEMRGLIGNLMDGELSQPVQAALLAALATKGETSDEIAGAAEALRSRVRHVEHSFDDAVDTCGTGGDGKGTFNISTAAALVASAAGIPIAKHGNRAVSSKSGSADVLEALGVGVAVAPETAARMLDEIGICFLFAPNYHPAMKEVMPVRKALGVRTIFNVLGPLSNPAGAKRQVLGVYARELVDVMAQVLSDLGSVHALVVHGADGLDEITITGPTHVAELRDGRVESRTLEPEELGVKRASVADLAGGGPVENAAILRSVLAGEQGPPAEITLANAGAAIYVGGKAATLAAGVELARETLASGAALAKLEALRNFRPGA